MELITGGGGHSIILSGQWAISFLALSEIYLKLLNLANSITHSSSLVERLAF